MGPQQGNIFTGITWDYSWKSNSDALIILHQILDKYCHKKNSTIYSCFVDYKKAFDTVPRDKFLRELHEMGISSKVCNIIKTCMSLTLPLSELATIILMPLK